MRSAPGVATFTLILILFLVTIPGQLLAQAVEAGATTQSVSTYPVRGMTMQAVKSSYGQPEKKTAAVGNPPISRWIYNNFTVYFEGQYVIHSVATDNKQ